MSPVNRHSLQESNWEEKPRRSGSSTFQSFALHGSSFDGSLTAKLGMDPEFLGSKNDEDFFSQGFALL